MTRTTFKRTLRRLYATIFLVLLASLAAKFAHYVPQIAGTRINAMATDFYEFMRDMSLLIATAGAAYVAAVFQKRSKFIESLEEEWRGIVRTKSALVTFCEKPYPSTDDYLAASARISETIDNMRIVYRNAGETEELIGLYPYAPLHDMRRALAALDPRKKQNITVPERKLVQDAVLQSFYALRETFLEELELEQPAHPLLISGGRRLKKSGATSRARGQQERQRALADASPSPRPDVDAFLSRLYAAEQATHSLTLGAGATGDQARGREV